jgi:hypothetical protein
MVRFFVLLIATLLGGSQMAWAEDSVLWTPSEVRGWTIAVDKTLANGCFIVSYFDGGTALRVGFDRRHGNAYVMLLNDNWRSIREGNEYQISVQFDSQAPWNASATGVRMGGSPGFIATTDKTDFMVEFMRQRGMSVTYSGREITRLSLRGTAAATQEMLRCQDAMNGGRSTVGSDPFESGSSGSGSDPFEQ